jgi:iron complex outermembrane receptor protein
MIRTLAAALATSTCIVALATPAAAQTREYNIPAGSLKSALDAYVRQSGRQIVYRADQVRSARSPGTSGQQSAEAALAAILAGSGFATRVDGNLVAIVRVGNGPAVAESSASSGEDDSAAGEDIVVTGTNIRGIVNRTTPTN